MDINTARQSPFSIDGTCNVTDVGMDLFFHGSGDADGVCEIKDGAFNRENHVDDIKTTTRQPVIAFAVSGATAAFLTAN